MNLVQNVENLLAIGKDVEAFKIGIEALAAPSKDPLAWYPLSLALYFLKLYELSVYACQKAIDLNPDLWDAYLFQEFPLHMLGKVRIGFERQEYRFLVFEHYQWKRNMLNTKNWQGEDISGKTLLVHMEIGFGDTIQFLRYVPYLKPHYHCNPVLFLQQELRYLFKGLEVPIVESVPFHDIHVNMMSLPFCFKTEIWSIPPPVKVDCCPNPVKGRIGLVWKAGGWGDMPKGKRILQLSQLDPILKIKGFHYVCAQKDVSSEDVKSLDAYGIARLPIDSFSDTVKILDTCELAIVMEGSVAHLAASMGIPTWILLPYNACWRWLADRPDSPWYPSARLFRQRRKGVWDDPIQQIKRELYQLLGSW